MEYDGSITIKTALDNKQVITDLREFAKVVKEAADKVSNFAAATRKSLDAQLRDIPRINKGYRDQLALVTQLAAQTKTFDASRQTEKQIPTTAQAAVAETGAATVSSIDKVNDAYQRQTAIVEQLQQQLLEMQGTQQESEEYASVTAELEKVGAEIDKIGAKQQKMAALYGVQKAQSMMAMRSMEYDIDRLHERYVELIEIQKEMLNAGTAYVPVDTSALQGKLSSAQEKQESMLARLNAGYNSLRNNIRTVENEGVRAHRRVADEGVKAHKKLNHHTKLNFNTVMKYVFGIRSVFFAYRKLRAAAKEALGLMAQSDPQLNKVISNFLTSVKQLKADIGTLIQPLVSSLAPVLTTLLNKLHSVILGFSEFIASLVGQDYIEVATVKTVDWANSLDDVGDAAKQTAKQLSALDKLNVISETGSDSAKDTAKSLQLTKDTVQYVKKEIDSSKWYVKLGQKLQGVFEETYEWLKKKFKNPEELLKGLGIALLGIKLGKLLLGGIASSGFGLGVANLLPAMLTIGVTAIVAFKFGNWLYENNEDVQKAADGFWNELLGDPEDKLRKHLNGETVEETDKSVIEQYIDAFNSEGVKGVLKQWGDNVMEVMAQSFEETAKYEGHLPVRFPSPRVEIEPQTSEDKKALDEQSEEYYLQLKERCDTRLKKFKNEVAPIITEFKVKFKEKWGVAPKEAFDNMKAQLLLAWNNPSNSVRTALTTMTTGFKTWWGNIWKTPEEREDTARENIKAIGRGITSAWSGENPVKTGLKSIKAGFSSLFTNAFNVSGEAVTATQTLSFSARFSALSSKIKSLWDAKDNPVKTTFQTIKDSMSSLWDSIFGTNSGQKGQSLIDAVTDGLNAVSGAAGKTGSSLNTALLSVGKKISEGINKGTISVPVTFTGQATPAGTGKENLPKINTTVTITLDGKTISNTVFDEAAKASKQTGSGAKALLHYTLA